MTKIERMSIAKIRHIVGIVTVERQHAMKDLNEQRIYELRMVFMELIRAWIKAEARAREAEHALVFHRDRSMDHRCANCRDWVVVIECEIGWLKGLSR